MVRANKPYIVPAEDQVDDHFFVPLSSQGLMVKLPLDANKVETVLRPLATWLNFPGAKSANKLALLAGIQENISLLPMSSAEARWPELGPIPTTPTSETYGLLVERLRTLKNADNTLRRDTPEFIPHLHAKMTELEAAIRTMEAEVRRKDDAERENKFTAPAWWDFAVTDVPPVAPYYKLTVQTESETHDGYCSDADVYTLDPKTSVLYLAGNDWTAKELNEKNTWAQHLDDHCCCGVKEVHTLMAWERVDANA